MSTAILWLRNDLRLHEHGGFQLAASGRFSKVLPVFIVEDFLFQPLPYIHLPSLGPFRKAFLGQSLQNLEQKLTGLGSGLCVQKGDAETILPDLMAKCGADTLIFETEDTAFEMQVERQIRRKIPALNIETWYGKTLLKPDELPFDLTDLPQVFTEFRKRVEKKGIHLEPMPLIQVLPPMPEVEAEFSADWASIFNPVQVPDKRTAFPFAGGEDPALARLHDYVWERKLASNYKNTRNGLVGEDYSTKFSPWLANGCLSAKRIYQEIKAFEAQYGESEQTYWIIFELLWRDYFRFTARKFGSRIFKSQGLKEKHELSPFKPDVFESWINGTTGNAFCDAAMNELRLTGYLSNRMRQNVASYLCHDLKQPWLAGAAWFEHCLIDYDPASNYGNWMYIAGVGNDPRANRYFSLAKQAEMYDPEGSYRAMWK